MVVEKQLSPAVEDYAKALYALESRGEGPVATNALAERLSLTPGSVSAMLKKLSELDLVAHSPYHGVALTDEGRRLALEVLRHHRLIELFLAEHLGMSWDRVHQEAEVLEHWLSEELEAAIDEAATVTLESLIPGQGGRFVRVSDSDADMLRFLAKRGIAPGQRLEVIDRQPFDGPVFISLDGQIEVLGAQLARAMRIQVETRPVRPLRPSAQG